MRTDRRDFLQYTFGAAAASALPTAQAQGVAPNGGIDARDRVFITNEDSNTLVVIDPRSNTVETTINLTSFDEEPRPPFRYVTAGVAPTHAAMIHKPPYHGCIDAHGAVPSPDGKLLATSGRGSSNIYLIDAVEKRVIGNAPNPATGPTRTLNTCPAASWSGASRTSPRSRATAASCGSRCAAKAASRSSTSSARCAS